MSEIPFITVDELLESVGKIKPHVDLDLGGRVIRVRLPASYDEMLDLEERKRQTVEVIRGSKCPVELRPYRKLTDDSIAIAATLSSVAMVPELSLEQSLRLTGDGITLKVIMEGFKRASVEHLMEAAAARIDEGKADSEETPPTG